MYVCVCRAVTDREIRQAVQLGACTLGDLKECLGVTTGCGKCAAAVRALLKEETGAASPFPFDLAPGT